MQSGSIENKKIFKLQPHPQSPDIVKCIEVALTRTKSGLNLHYLIKGGENILLPPKALAQFTNDLWKHTCCELFIRPHGENEYIEFNFSPSSQWAAYGFSGYRAGMKPLDVFSPNISTSIDGNNIEVKVDVTGTFPQGQWDVNVTAVLEGKEGQKSYFALAHIDGNPNFHAQECFIGKVE